MPKKTDGAKCLNELEGVAWSKPSYHSHVIEAVHQLRTKPLREFSIEDLRITIGQKVGLSFLVPIALDQLERDPLVEGDFYPGDLLSNVLSIDLSFWESNAEARERLEGVLSTVTSPPDEIADAVRAYREGTG